MDITTVFGTVVPGSSPGGGTKVNDTGKEGKSHDRMCETRIWFSGRTRPCQGRDGSPILPIRTEFDSCANVGSRNLNIAPFLPVKDFCGAVDKDVNSGDKGHV